jgi:RHS repeat-associated protein
MGSIQIKSFSCIAILLVCISFYAGDCFGDSLAIIGPDAPTEGSQYAASGGTAPYFWCISKGGITQGGAAVSGLSGLSGTATITVIDSYGAIARQRVRMPNGVWFPVQSGPPASCSNPLRGGCDWINCGNPESSDTMCKFSYGAASCRGGSYYCSVSEIGNGYRSSTTWGGQYSTSTVYYGVTGTTAAPFDGAIAVSASRDEWRSTDGSNGPENLSCTPPPCGLDLSIPTANPAKINAGDSTMIAATVTSSIPYTLTMTVAGKTLTGQIWDGTGSFGFPVDPKVYQATVTARNYAGCSVHKDVAIQVLKPPESCDFKRTAESSVNLATGNLTHDQALFSTSGSGLVTSISLYYNSLDIHSGPFARGWSHSYDISLNLNDDGSMMLHEGNGGRKLYYLVGGAYQSQAPDNALLSRDAAGTFTLTQMDGSKQIFDADGKISSMVDKNGATINFTYEESNLSSVIDSAGRTSVFEYDENNKLTDINDPMGNKYSFAYAGGNLVSVTNPDGGYWSYTYDDNGLFLSKTDPGGNMVSYLYDGTHRLISSIDPAGKTRDLDIPGASANTTKSMTFKEKDGGEWHYSYDSAIGRLTSQTDPLGNITSYTNDAIGNRTSVTDPAGATTRYSYDGQGNMLTITDPLGSITSYTYDTRGQVLAIAGPQGTTSNTYDSTGNLVTTTDPAGATTTREYDAQGNMTRITNVKGQNTTFVYDVAGLVTSTTDPTGSVTRYTHDANGNMLTQTDPAGKVSIYTYDGMNRLVTVTDPLGNVTANGYDKMGNRVSVTDANGNVTSYKYNYHGQMIESKDALGNITTYTYDATGCASCGGGVDKLTALFDAKGQATNYQYDLLGRLIQETDSLQKVTLYNYDPAGNMDLKTDANGIHLGYGYDLLKRMTAKTYPDGSSISYTYDSAGRIHSVGNNIVTYTYQYDEAGRVASASDSRGYKLNYNYDLLGNRTQVTFQPETSDQRVTSYAYDDLGRLSGITAPAGKFSYVYDASGRRVSLSYPNQITASYTYDDAGRLISLIHAGSDSTIASFSYALDKVGNRTSKTATAAERYLYDTIYKLLAVTSSKMESFGYDAVGNRLRGPGAKDTAYLHNAGNQIIQGRRLAYGYDNNGNQTSRTVPAASDKNWTQTWDYENRLVKVEKVKGAEKRTVSFSYDPMGRRIGKQIIIVKAGVTKTNSWGYVYDNDDIVQEVYTDQSGAVTKTIFTHGAGVDEHLAMERGGQFYYYHADGLGSVVGITDASKSVVQNYEYDSFGMVKPQTRFANSYTYTGREWDKETGLYYYRARYYDPMEGRFISKDPIGFDGGANLFAYTANNPVDRVDPEGENWLTDLLASWLKKKLERQKPQLPAVCASALNVATYDEADAKCTECGHNNRLPGDFTSAGVFRTICLGLWCEKHPGNCECGKQ